MIKYLKKSLGLVLPLRIREATFEDILLTLIGNEWNFNTNSPWRILEGGAILYGSATREVECKVAGLRGQEIVDVSYQSLNMRSDPTFHLSSGQLLEVFSDQGYEPWLMTLPDMTYVAAPDDRRYVD